MKQRLAFALIMGMITTGLISFALISINIGFGNRFLTTWLRSWAIAYVLAVFSMLLIAPRIQFLVNSLFRENFTTEKDE